MTVDRKPLILNAFDMACLGLQLPGLWKHPDDQSRRYNTIEYWTNLAQLLERGKFTGLFIADVLGGYDVYNGPRNISAAALLGAQWPVNEPSLAVPAMAAVTKHLTFGITFSTISEQPYHFARRLATLDHLTNGRVGWNVVTSYLDLAARNLLAGEELPPREKRYQRADEYLQVVYKLLLLLWRDDAVVLKNGVFTDPERVREINHQGEYFTVPGPAITEPTPQRLPVILQAGASKEGIDFAARNAEVVFLTNFTPESLGAKIAEINEAAAKYGRGGQIKFLQLITVVVADTHEAAEKKFLELKSYGDLDGAQALFSGWTGIDIGQFDENEELRDTGLNAVKGFVENWTKLGPGELPDIKKTRKYVAEQITIGGIGPVFWGTPKEVADVIEHWVDVSGVDGFNVTYAITPGSFEDVVNYVVPELQQRGLVQTEYPAEQQTYREQLFGEKFVPEQHPAHKLRWTSAHSKAEFDSLV